MYGGFLFSVKRPGSRVSWKLLIRDINIGIDKGEIVTLIGPTARKSTILKKYYKTVEADRWNGIFDDTSLMELSYKELSSKMAVVLPSGSRQN